MDGIGNNADVDDDEDSWNDVNETACGTDPLDALSIPSDLDNDTWCDFLDPDDDGDGVADIADAYPADPTEWNDTDGDGTGDNADLDDDGDGWSDNYENLCVTNPLDDASTPVDTDSDGSCDFIDDDDDDDGTPDASDDFPLDQWEHFDFDGDGIGNNADTDDDGDGVIDVQDPFPLDASEWADSDGDGIGNTMEMESTMVLTYSQPMLLSGLTVTAMALAIMRTMMMTATA
ncbi:MAG: hypothetical protein CXT72_04365 [Methanobacteriota archaeon]|nr:MAG: hypothetical protein CXT72_04365 [Euryarchaeota archaeon]